MRESGKAGAVASDSMVRDVIWDVIVVGAGPAGCAAAYDLAAAGKQVLLLDRARFPRDKACAGGLTMKAVRALRYPVDPVVRRWERRIVLAGTGGAAVAVSRPGRACAMTVRRELDSYCLEQTLKRGARFERVGHLLSLEQTKAGVRLQFADELHVRARYAIGADGVQSRVRALLGGADWFRMGFAVEANVDRCPGDAPVPLTFDFAPVERGYGWLFPRDSHVNVGLYTEALPGRVRIAGEPEASRLNRAALERYVAACMPVERESGMEEVRSRAGQAMGPVVGQYLGLGAAAYRPPPDTRVLLAGDAAGFVDPLTGEGIYGAIRSGQAAAEALVKALAAPAGIAPALGFEKAARALQADLRVAEYAATRFFENPARGFALMRRPWVARLVLECYSRGLPLRWLLKVTRLVRWLSQNPGR